MKGPMPFGRALILALAAAVVMIAAPAVARADAAPKVTLPSTDLALSLSTHVVLHGRAALEQCSRFSTPVEFARCITPHSTRAVVTRSLQPDRLPSPVWDGLRETYLFPGDLGSEYWW
jgi:hypothetical protein